jgi:hypothetical protein
MKRESLDLYDTRPYEMIQYLRHNGMHFNRKMCDFAVSKMTKINSNGKQEKITIITKQTLDELLKRYNITLNNNQLYDYVYVANMCKADFLGSSIKDEEHLAHYVKDVIDDDDAYDGIVFNRWYADMCRLGIPIDWEEML